MTSLVKSSLQSNDSLLTVSLFLDNDEGVTGPLHFTLSEHDEIGITFFMSAACERVKNGGWEFKHPIEPSDRRRLLHLVQVSDAREQVIQIPESQLFFEPTNEGTWRGGDEAEAELKRISDAHEERFSVILTADNSDASDPVYASIVLVDNLLVTARRRIPGMAVIPITGSTLGSDGSQVLNSVLQQFGYKSLIDPDQWLVNMQRRRPAAIMHVEKIRAPTPQVAVAFSRELVREFLDLMALKRGDTPRIIGGVIGGTDSEGAPQCLGSWMDGSQYTGNLIGGFTAGEDPHSINVHWQAARNDPRIRLWLSLYADALSDERWDYRLFRCFNLLEGIATQLIPSKKKVEDAAGKPRLKVDGKPYTAQEARSKVYLLALLVAEKNNQAASNFTYNEKRDGQVDLWEEVNIWVSVRNSVAHTGSWASPKGQSPTTRQSDIERVMSKRGHDGTLASGAWATVRVIRTVVESTLFAALQHRI
ncbi:hypothetical protein [Streptomyces sp. NPDC057284]|uniref:hypothetical protein n=1 Tax=Streptomyces sp. NPDC057284 TaxID=3346083 RepID=UPI00362CB4B4